MGAFGTAEHAIIQEINMKENILSVSKERERNRSRTLGTVRASLSVDLHTSHKASVSSAVSCSPKLLRMFLFTPYKHGQNIYFLFIN